MWPSRRRVGQLNITFDKVIYMLRVLVFVLSVLLSGCVATVSPRQSGGYFSERDIEVNGSVCRMVVDGSGEPVLLMNSYFARSGGGCENVQAMFNKPIKEPVELGVAPNLVTVVWPTGVLRISVNKFNQPRGKWTAAPLQE
jgi:hypothetical protein